MPDPMQVNNHWLTTEDAARLTGYSPEYLRRLVRKSKDQGPEMGKCLDGRVVGIDEAGNRDGLGFCVGEREDLLEDLKRRDVAQVDLWITDGNPAMLNALQAKFPHSKRQRCIKHKICP